MLGIFKWEQRNMWVKTHESLEQELKFVNSAATTIPLLLCKYVHRNDVPSVFHSISTSVHKAVDTADRI